MNYPLKRGEEWCKSGALLVIFVDSIFLRKLSGTSTQNTALKNGRNTEQRGEIKSMLRTRKKVVTGCHHLGLSHMLRQKTTGNEDLMNETRRKNVKSTKFVSFL